MKTVDNNFKNELGSRIFTVLLLIVVSITFAINPNMQDPFNTPKQIILFTGVLWLFGYIVVFRKNYFSITSFHRLILKILILFNIFSIISAINSPDLYTSIFGENMRKNGFLTYLCLSIILFTTMRYVRDSKYTTITTAISLLSLVLAIYGLLQFNGSDFIKWANPYNPIITTSGNPNFASAQLAIFASMIFSLLINTVGWLKRSMYLCIFMILLSTILLSNAKQGFLTLVIGVFFSVVVKSFYFGRRIGITVLSFATVASVFIVLGMLQIGPLTKFIYKESVSLRGYYWRAGLKMFQDNSIFGVGLDSYQNNFKLYRDESYSLRFGYEVTSSAAHNVPINMLATGGIFVGIFYLLILGITLYMGVKNLRNKNINSNMLTLVCSGFVAYLAQSFVSIDNISLSIWGWFLSGLILGLVSQNITNKTDIPSKAIQMVLPKQVLLSSLLIVLAIYPLAKIYESETSMVKTRIAYSSKDPAFREVLYRNAEKVISNPFSEPFYKFQSALYLATQGYEKFGLDTLDKLVSSNPKNLDYLIYRVDFYEQRNDVMNAIDLRKKIVALDPYNLKNYLKLGLLYKSIGNNEAMKDNLNLIINYLKNSKYKDSPLNKEILESAVLNLQGS